MRYGLSQLGMIAASGCTKHLLSTIAQVSMMLTWESCAQEKSLSAGYKLLSTKQQLATQLFGTQSSWCLQFICWINLILKALVEKCQKELESTVPLQMKQRQQSESGANTKK
jgi:hypothetical protein